MVQQMMGLVSWFRWLVDWEASGREGGVVVGWFP